VFSEFLKWCCEGGSTWRDNDFVCLARHAFAFLVVGVIHMPLCLSPISFLWWMVGDVARGGSRFAVYADGDIEGEAVVMFVHSPMRIRTLEEIRRECFGYSCGGVSFRGVQARPLLAIG
jgi:hypothetical protein